MTDLEVMTILGIVQTMLRELGFPHAAVMGTCEPDQLTITVVHHHRRDDATSSTRT